MEAKIHGSISKIDIASPRKQGRETVLSEYPKRLRGSRLNKKHGNGGPSVKHEYITWVFFLEKTRRLLDSFFTIDIKLQRTTRTRITLCSLLVNVRPVVVSIGTIDRSSSIEQWISKTEVHVH
jgi:hypothetical protein